MTEEARDPTLETLFAEFSRKLPAQPFVDQLMSRTDKSRRRALFARISLGAALALLALTFQDVALALTRIPLITVEEGLLAQLLAPVNHLGSLLSLAAIGLRVAYKKIFTGPLMN